MPRLDLPTPYLIGVVHLWATPGAPGFEGALRFDAAMDEVLSAASTDAEALARGGCDALIVENFGDVPFFPTEVPSETIAAMALAVREVQAVAGDLPVGVNVLRNDARAALGLCAATGARFLRVNVHCGAALTDQGLIEGRAAQTVRERDRIAPWAAILADVHVKHAEPMAERDVALAAAETFGRGRADAVILTGRATGEPPDAAVLIRVRERVGDQPVLVGSGLTTRNAPELLALADGAIVGTSLKHGGRVEAPVDAARVARLVGVVGRGAR